MKLLNMLTISLSDVVNVIALMSGISSLIFSGVTWTNLENTKTEIGKHHNELKNNVPSISDITRYKNSSEIFLKRLDRDIDILFRDLGKLNERSNVKTKNLRLTLENGTMDTNEKIRKNTENLEMSYKNLNQRLSRARGIINTQVRDMSEMNRKVIKNTRDLKVLKIFLRKHTKNETL